MDQPLNVSVMSPVNESLTDIDCTYEDLAPEVWDTIDAVILWIGGYVPLAVAVIGVLTNSLAISVFSRKSFRTNFNLLLLALAVFDRLFLLVSITESIRGHFEDIFGNSSVGISGHLTQVLITSLFVV